MTDEADMGMHAPNHWRGEYEEAGSKKPYRIIAGCKPGKFPSQQGLNQETQKQP